ncbi:MAG: hypothetical protein P4L35_10230 [Ignavibacteriaceae bacterium]|nr:hypothetical protein [Ignavibacteriaceae bacterium]
MKEFIEKYFKKVGDTEQIRYLLASKDRDENNIVLGLILFNILDVFPSMNYELVNNNLSISQVTEAHLTRLEFSFKNDRLYLYLFFNSLTLFNKSKEYDPVIVDEIRRILSTLGFISEEENFYSDTVKYYTYTWK